MTQGASKRIAVITGASSGMGREFAVQIDARGEADELWLVARHEDALEKTAATLATPARCIAADLADPAALESLRKDLDQAGANVVYLVNAAGFGKFGSWRDVSDQAASGMIDLNCRAVVALTRACLPHMQRGSHVIQLASCAAFVSLPHMNVYAASKAFVLSYTRALRWELHGTGITATAVCPAWVKTGFESVARSAGEATAKDSGGSAAKAGGEAPAESTADASRDAKQGHAQSAAARRNKQGVNHLLFQQKASTVVKRALVLNKLHFAVATCGIPAWCLRIVGKFLPRCITMAGWEALRRI